MVEEKRFAGIDEMVAALTDHMAARLTEAVEARGRASLAVSGGSTPRPLFRSLAKRPVPWEGVTLTLVDERWVDPAGEESNERLVRECLLRGPAAAARFIPLKNGAPDAGAGVAECQGALSAFAGPFDILLLGMGGDGHTASLFPGADSLKRGLGLEGSVGDCLAVTPPDAPHERMSLSFPRLLNSREILLMITGEEKWRVYREALSAGGAEAMLRMPVAAILGQEGVPVKVYWA